MTPFNINFAQILNIFDATILYNSKFCLHFEINRQQFVLYKPSLASPLLCKHIPSLQHYPAYQVFFLCSPFLSLDRFLNHKKIDELPQIAEINTIIEPVTKSELSRFIFGLVPFSPEIQAKMQPEDIYFYKVAKAMEENLDIKIPLYINKNNTLSFVYACLATNQIQQICDFSCDGYQNRFSSIKSYWHSPSFAHQSNALVCFLPSTFLQYVSQRSLTDERAFVYSPDFTHSNVFERFLSNFNCSPSSIYPSLFLTYSHDMGEVISCIGFLCYLINYYCNMKVSFNVAESHVELTFTFTDNDETNLMFSNIFNKSLAMIRDLLGIDPQSEIDHDFFSLFKPTWGGDVSRYMPEDYPEGWWNDAIFIIPKKMESLVSFLLQLPVVLHKTYSDINPYKFEVVMMNPYEFNNDDN